MSNHSSDNTPVILGVIGGVLLLGFVAVVGVFFVAGFFFFQLAAPPRGIMPVSTVETVVIEDIPQELPLPTEVPVPAPVPDIPPTSDQPIDAPVIAPVPDTGALP